VDVEHDPLAVGPLALPDCCARGHLVLPGRSRAHPERTRGAV